jgi:hypothetical protein
MTAQRMSIGHGRDQRLNRRPDSIDHHGVKRAHRSGTSTRSSVDGQHPASKPGHHDDRWMVNPKFERPIRAAS